MDIPPAYISLMNCAIVVKRVKESDSGRSSRRATIISEITNASTSNTAFSWNPRTGDFEETLQDSQIFKKIADSTGLDLTQILEEHQRRISILKWMIENGIRDYKTVSEIIGRYYRDPESLIQKICEV
jgi:flagellar protein FlaI